MPGLAVTLGVGLLLVEPAILTLGYGLKVTRIPGALKPLLRSLARTLAGLSLAADPDFQPGATVQVGKKGTVDHVLSMDTRKTRIRTPVGKVHAIPGAVIDKTEWAVLESKGYRNERCRKSILKRK